MAMSLHNNLTIFLYGREAFWQFSSVAVNFFWQFSCMAMTLRKYLNYSLTIFLYGHELFDNFPVWLWAQNQFYLFFTIAMAYRWKFFLWKSFEMFLTIFLYGFELFWQFYCMAMTLQIYQQKVWQFSCVVFWQFSCLDFWQFSCLGFWQFSGSPIHIAARAFSFWI